MNAWLLRDLDPRSSLRRFASIARCVENGDNDGRNRTKLTHRNVKVGSILGIRQDHRGNVSDYNRKNKYNVW